MSEITDLYDEGQENAAQAQAEALEWADEQGLEEWSNGDPIQRPDTTDSEPELEEKSEITDLYDEGQENAAQAQAEALEWADEQGLEEWSGGDPIQRPDTTDSEPELEENNDADPENPLDDEERAKMEEELAGMENEYATSNEYRDKLADQMSELNDDKLNGRMSEDEYTSYYDEKWQAHSDTVNKLEEQQEKINQLKERLGK